MPYFVFLCKHCGGKWKVIQKNCTKAYYLLSVMWFLMSSGFHFCLLSSPLNDLPFSVRFVNVKCIKKVDKGFPNTAVYYAWDAMASEADLRHDFRLSATSYSVKCLESEGENPEICYCAGSRVRFEEKSIEHETF